MSKALSWANEQDFEEGTFQQPAKIQHSYTYSVFAWSRRIILPLVMEDPIAPDFKDYIELRTK